MIAETWLKRKIFTRAAWEPFVLPAIVILVGISAFALGRLSALAGADPMSVLTPYEKTP